MSTGSLLLLFLYVNLVICQTGTYKLTSTPASFYGFYSVNPTSAKLLNCASTATWSTSSTYGGCCAIDVSCTPVTTCVRGTLTRKDGSVYVCPSTASNCYVRTVLPSWAPNVFGATGWTQHYCTTEGVTVFTVFREIVPPETATVTKVLTADGPGTTITIEPSPSSTKSSTSTTTPRIPELDEELDSGPDSAPEAEPGAGAGGQGDNRSQQTDTPPPPPGGSAAATESPSKAWIAGAVVGPLLALTALGVLIFWLARRSAERRIRAESSIGPGGRAELGQEPHAGSPPPLYAPGPAREKHEMPVYYQGPGEHPPQRYSLPPAVHELPPAEMPPQELAGR